MATRCPRCGYWIKRQDGNECPQCGFSLNNQRNYRSSHISGNPL
jgi:ribosomal protein L37E